MALKGQFDIGNIYFRDKQYYLAVHNQTLITRANGAFKRLSTGHDNYIQVNDFSVRKLCKSWKIPIKYLDREIQQYFSPSIFDRNNARYRKEHKYDDDE